jgi:hypothetical protein
MLKMARPAVQPPPQALVVNELWSESLYLNHETYFHVCEAQKQLNQLVDDGPIFITTFSGRHKTVPHPHCTVYLNMLFHDMEAVVSNVLALSLGYNSTMWNDINYFK